MVKAHRAARKAWLHKYRDEWWIPLFERNGWLSDLKNGTFGEIPEALRSHKRYVLEWTRYCGDAPILEVPPNHSEPVTREAGHSRHSERRALEPGIPAGVDIIQWYAVYIGREHLKEKQPKTTKEKHKHYRDLAIDLYKASGYKYPEYIHRAFTPQGEDLMRYLANDKRHTLNRGQESEEIEDEDEEISALPESPTF